MARRSQRAIAAAESQAKSRNALRERGGRLIHIGLEADAVALLDEMKAEAGPTATDRDVIAAALQIACAGRLVQATLTRAEAAMLDELRQITGASERDAIAAAIKGEVARARRRAAA